MKLRVATLKLVSMGLSKFLTRAVVMAALAVLLVVAANSNAATVTLNPAGGSRTESIEVEGSHFPKSKRVTIEVYDGKKRKKTKSITSSKGSFSKIVTAPKASGQSSSLAKSLRVTTKVSRKRVKNRYYVSEKVATNSSDYLLAEVASSGKERFRLELKDGGVEGGKAVVKLYGLKAKKKTYLYFNNGKVKSFRASKKGKASYSFSLTDVINGSNKVTVKLSKKRSLKVNFTGVVELPPAPEPQPTTTTTDPGTTTTVSTTTTTVPTPTGQTATLAAVGDIACDPADGVNPCEDEKVADVVETIDPDALALLGDIQYENGTLSAFNAVFDVNWSRFSNIWKPVPGNHEYYTSNASGYYSYFGSDAGDPTKGYYSYELGDWKVFALNSNCLDVPCSAGSVQEQWLRAELAASSNKCILAYWHHPLFSSGIHGNDTAAKPFWEALEEYNADVILVGHDHDYERFSKQTAEGVASSGGIREFVVGTGGKNNRGFSSISGNTEAYNDSTDGALKLTLKPTSYDWEFVPEAGGTYTDSGSQSCIYPVALDS